MTTNAHTLNNPPNANRAVAAADTEALRNVSAELQAAVLANENVKLAFKLSGAAS